MTDKLWICEICGYELPAKFEILKHCPNCNSVWTFILSKKYYVVNKILPDTYNNLLFIPTYLPLLIFDTLEQAQKVIFELPANNLYKISWILEETFNLYRNKGVQYATIR